MATARATNSVDAWLPSTAGPGRQSVRNQLLTSSITRFSPAHRVARRGRFCRHSPLNG